MHVDEIFLAPPHLFINIALILQVLISIAFKNSMTDLIRTENGVCITIINIEIQTEKL